MSKFWTLVCAGLAFSVVSARADSQVVKLDPAVSKVGWEASKVTGKHHGTVQLKSGEVTLQNGMVQGGQVVMDMSSIKDVDLTDPEWNKKLIDHLKSDDFFSVDKHPTASFRITGIKPIANAPAGKPNYEVTGDLTIKDKTNPVSFPAWISVNGGKAEAKGTMTVDRTKYDIKFRSGKFYENLGDTLIHDNFKIDLNLVGTI